MALKVKNNAVSKLASAITSTATSLTLAAGDGNLKFPSLSTGDFFHIYVVDANKNFEIMKVTARTADALTVTRGQQATTARAFVVNDAVELRMTESDINQFALDTDVQNEAHHWAGSATGSANAINLTVTPAITAYVAGQRFGFLSSAANTGAVTVSVSGLTATAVNKTSSSGTLVALAANDIPAASRLVAVQYDGTRFMLLDPVKEAAGATTDPTLLDDYSATVAQMKLNVDPGEGGAESQATSLAGELERLRFAVFEAREGTNFYKVSGARCINNSTTPNTQYDLDADYIVLRRDILAEWYTTGSVLRLNPAVVTNNISTAGPAANGRDQAAAFGASTWIHFYWIWNGTTLASVSSLTAPPTGPVRPSGYTHWAYAGAVRNNATPRLLRTLITDGWAMYDENRTGDVRVVNADGSTTFTVANCNAVIPPGANRAEFTSFSTVDHTADTVFNVDVRPINSTATDGTQATNLIRTNANDFIAHSSDHFSLPMTDLTTRGFEFKWSAAGATTTQFTAIVVGYAVHNGG